MQVMKWRWLQCPLEVARRRPTARMSTGGRAPLGTKVASGSCGQQRYVTSDGLMKLVTQ